MYSVVSILLVVIGISLTAAWLDKFVLHPRMASWRQKALNIWVNMNEESHQTLTRDANSLFCDLYDHIYGKSHFSRRRFLTSFFATTVSLFIVTLIIGYYGTIWPDIFESIEFLFRTIYINVIKTPDNITPPLDTSYWYISESAFLSVVPVFLNYIPDFLSLIETRYVLYLSRKRSGLGIFVLIIFDLVATATIFSIGLILWFIAKDGFEFVPILIERPLEFIKILIQPDEVLPFFLTTFVTSFLWIMYVMSYVILRILHRIMPVTNYVLYVMGASKRPVSAMSSFVVLLIIVIWLGLITTNFIIETAQ